MGRLEGKIAIVTGGARGMGEAIVRMFVEQGAAVLIGDILEAEGKALAQSLGDKALFHLLDVTQPAAWDSAIARCVDAFGGLDILVNNAGVMFWGKLEDTNDEHYERVVSINQTGVFLGMRAAITPMRKRGGGAIVNNSSIGGMTGSPGAFAYVASKWAVRGMTKAAALELAADNIRVNSIHPGPIRTPMIEGVESVAAMSVPLNRVGEPRQVAYLATYLASEESAFTTGTEHVIDGGVTAA